jgi:hypothetical protein
MSHRAQTSERSARPDWGWDGVRPLTVLGWGALGLVLAHVALLVVLQLTHRVYWRPEELWSDAHVVAAATVFACSAVVGATLALFATVRRGEQSVLMLVPVVLGAFWAFWLLGSLDGWLS